MNVLTRTSLVLADGRSISCIVETVLDAIILSSVFVVLERNSSQTRLSVFDLTDGSRLWSVRVPNLETTIKIAYGMRVLFTDGSMIGYYDTNTRTTSMFRIIHRISAFDYNSMTNELCVVTENETVVYNCTGSPIIVCKFPFSKTVRSLSVANGQILAISGRIPYSGSSVRDDEFYVIGNEQRTIKVPEFSYSRILGSTMVMWTPEIIRFQKQNDEGVKEFRVGGVKSVHPVNDGIGFVGLIDGTRVVCVFSPETGEFVTSPVSDDCIDVVPFLGWTVLL
jgi:hypothetical protein